MRKRRILGAVAVLTIVTLVGAACKSGTSNPGVTPPGGGTGPTNVPNPNPQKGGVYRTAIEDFGFTNAFDPTGEYLGFAWGIFSQLLLRTLVTYDHTAGVPGDSLVPDLAESMPQISTDGLTYTFKIKQGVKFGPPLDRQVTSADVAYAFQRIDSAPLIAQYGFYYDGTIAGMNGPVNKPADAIHISGISTPDPATIVFTLTKPTADFLYRVAMPATAAIPPEVAKCFPKAGDYGRDVISDGPYMIAGQDKLDVSSCSTIKPISGYDATTHMNTVRNPDYDASTDNPDPSTKLSTDRPAYVDGISLVIDTNTDDIFHKIQAGDLDGTTGTSTPSPQVLAPYLTDPNLKQYIFFNSADTTLYITMNLLTPPFDDVHVRKAVNLALNKDFFRKVWGGPTRGAIATHIVPPSLLDFGGENYDPYATPSEAGDIAAAQKEMAQSAYDPGHTGKCTDPVCNNILFINRNYGPRLDMGPSIVSSLSQLGLNLTERDLSTGTAYTTIQTVSNLIPIAANAGWGKDYGSPTTFLDTLFRGASSWLCQGQTNYSEIGFTAANAKQCGVTAAYNKVVANGNPPISVDDKINQCEAPGLSASDATSCWVDLDKYISENVVPWVPYLWINDLTVVGKTVTNYDFDQFSAVISFVRMAVNNNISATTLS